MGITKYFEQQWDRIALIHPETKKEWFIEIDGNTIRSQLGTGKILIKEVDSSSIFPPFHRAILLVMEKLRKGFIYYNPKAETGEAACHRFIGKSHTGFMPIAARTDRDDFYVTRVIGDFEDEILVHYSGCGEILSIKSLGAHSITFSMSWNDEQILCLDREVEDKPRTIYAYDVKTGAFVSEMNEDLYKISNYLEGASETKNGHQLLPTEQCRNITVRIEMGLCLVEIFADDASAPSMQIINEFSVKPSNATLTKNNLVLHSDYGMISIYKIS